MSSETVGKIIEKALEDPQFREALMAAVRAATRDYDLSEEELTALEAAMTDTFQGQELEARISKRRMGGKFGSFTGPMDIDGAVE